MGEFFYNLRVEISSNYNLEVIKYSKKYSLGLFISCGQYSVKQSLFFWLCEVFEAAGFSVVLTVGGYSFVVVYRPLPVGASPVAEHRLEGKLTSVGAARGLSSCGAWT